ncbi:PQQ-dependent sugar dehydrogenase [Paraliomyxa miuraensis]|uniref:PQQ-dependent sugar dehydrogenase n=1 Tax=Paraliomyxa miuraensis TaxID=376150 RepID=UPI002258D591|nr:PQQ-dependent sugar dehydrogenase [Paraliomyxa miuraensis]MCX4245135.1 PQQ-dependent sugar dehydrogenase [Paraliomyxa miuraensis]
MATRAKTWGLLLLLAAPACREDPSESTPADDSTTGSATGSDEATEAPPSGPPLPPRPQAQSCRFDGWAPGLLPPLSFDPTDVPSVPGARALAAGLAGTVLVGTDDGRLVVLDPTDALEPMAELRPADGNRITGLALASTAGLDAVFVRSETDAPARTRITRFTLTDPHGLDPASALEVIAIDHDGPDVRRGAGLLVTEGLLWIPLGDDREGDDVGPADDPHLRAGNLLRLDVSTLAVPHGYDLPPDNPLAGEGGVAAETWAFGLRDPAGCVHDSTHDRIWCADVGADVSEVSLVPAAAFLGWPRLEGNDCQVFGGCDNLDSQLPQATHRHADGDCGPAFPAPAEDMDPELDGALVYADRCSGKLLAARPAQGGKKSTRAVVGQLDPAPAALASDPSGGIWAIDADGRLGRLVVERPPGEFPTVLSASGCFAGGGVTSPAPDLVPYTLNAPLWTDGSHKQRHLVLPPGTRIAVQDDGSLRFPVGTTILKTFSYALDPFAPDVLTPVETRVMIRRSWAWEFHGYAWNEDGTEAELLDGGQSRIMLTSLEGAPTVVDHTFPSRDECGYCHGTGDVRALGPRLDQLDRWVDYDGVLASQLDALADIDLFEGPLPAPPPIADYTDPEAPLEDRARAYLHANCGHCHRPGGWTPPALDMDMRWTTPTAQTRLCGVAPQYSSTFDADHRVAPGAPQDSLIWLRLSTRGPWQMPPVATSVPDPHAWVVHEWIDDLELCPEQ